jgi:MFS family permease
MGGRLVFGLLGDRFGAARVLVLALLAQAIVALGSVLGGMIYDTFSSYAWRFIGAFSLGIGALLAALAFTRLPRRRVMAAVA